MSKVFLSVNPLYEYLKQIELKLNRKSFINMYNSGKIEKKVDKKPYCQKEIQVYFSKKNKQPVRPY